MVEIPQNRIYIADPMIYFYLVFLDSKNTWAAFSLNG